MRSQIKKSIIRKILLTFQTVYAKMKQERKKEIAVIPIIVLIPIS